MAKKKTAAKKGSRDERVDFEAALAEVERIVADLEGGELDLTTSLERYETGIKRLKECHAILNQAQQQVTLLSGFDADGNPVTEPLPDSTQGGGGRRATDPSSGEVVGGQSSVDDSPGLF